jgi:hypothetical protein
MDFDQLDLIRVFDHDPDLLEGIEAPLAAHLRRRLVARRGWVERGAWAPSFTDEETVGHLGLLVMDGLLIQTVRLGAREASEIVGPGDLLRPWDSGEAFGSVDAENRWRVLEPVSFAVLDQDFARRVARWPTINARLLARSTRRTRMLVYQATIAQVRHAETRILLALWHLADRWGKVTPAGVRVPVPLTHQLLAQITCLQRPTVSTAVSRLAETGRLSRVRGGGWLLHGEPPSLIEAQGGTPDIVAPAPLAELAVA